MVATGAADDVTTADELTSAAELEDTMVTKVEDAGAVVSGMDVAGTVEAGTLGVMVKVTGQIVVDKVIVDVTTVVESAGQFVMVGAHEVMVISVVVKTVEVLKDVVTYGADEVTTAAEEVVTAAAEEVITTAEEVVAASLLAELLTTGAAEEEVLLTAGAL